MRRYMDETLEHELARARREGCALALVMLDVDHFKRIDNTYGHAGGDELLRQLGRLLRALCREGGVACRYGGEESLLLPGLQEPALGERAEFWRRSVEAMVVSTHAGAAFSVTVSLGVAVFPADARDVRSLQRSADRALYRAKQNGRNRVEFASAAEAQQANEPAL